MSKEIKSKILNHTEIENIRMLYQNILKEYNNIINDKMSAQMTKYTFYSYIIEKIEGIVNKLSIELCLSRNESKELKNEIYKIIYDEDKKRRLFLNKMKNDEENIEK